MVGKKQTRSESCFSSEIYLFCCVLFGFFICASLSLLSRLSFLFHSIHPHPKDDDDEDYETRMIIDKVFFFSLPPPPQHQLWGAMTVNTQRRTTIANQSTVLVLLFLLSRPSPPVDIIPLVLLLLLFCCWCLGLVLVSRVDWTRYISFDSTWSRTNEQRTRQPQPHPSSGPAPTSCGKIVARIHNLNSILYLAVGRFSSSSSSSWQSSSSMTGWLDLRYPFNIITRRVHCDFSLTFLSTVGSNPGPPFKYNWAGHPGLGCWQFLLLYRFASPGFRFCGSQTRRYRGQGVVDCGLGIPVWGTVKRGESDERRGCGVGWLEKNLFIFSSSHSCFFFIHLTGCCWWCGSRGVRGSSSSEVG